MRTPHPDAPPWPSTRAQQLVCIDQPHRHGRQGLAAVHGDLAQALEGGPLVQPLLAHHDAGWLAPSLLGGATVGAATSLASGTVNGNLSLKGGIQALLGGKFRDGAIAGFASGLAELASANIGASIKQAVEAGTMTPAEAMAARSFNTVLSSAIRAAGSPGDPAHAFANDWLSGLMTEFMPGPVQGEGPWSSVDHRNGSDIDDDRGGGAHAFPVPPPAPAVIAPLPASQSTTEPGATPPPSEPVVLLTDTPDGSGPVLSLGRGPDLVGDTRVVPGEHVYPAQAQLAPGTTATLMEDEQGQQFWRLDGAQVAGGRVDVVMGASASADASHTLTQLRIVEAGLAASVVAGEALTGDALIALANRALAATGRAAVTTLAEAAPIVAPALLVLGGLIVPTNATQEVISLGAGERFVTRPGELYGVVERQNADGDWLIAKPNARLVVSGNTRVALTDEEIRQLQVPLINVPAPPPSPLPGVVPAPRDSDEGILVNPRPEPIEPRIETLPATDPKTIDELIITSHGFEPGTAEHKAATWDFYQTRGGDWDYDRWSNVYDANQLRAIQANAAVDAYHDQLGWGKREQTVSVTINGRKEVRRLDIVDVEQQRAVEYKTGYQYLSAENLWELQRDAQLVNATWDVEWVFRDSASQPLLDALRAAGIRVKVGD